MDRAKFFAALRKRDSGVFGTSLSQSQVDGLENLLDVQAAYLPDMPLDELAYDLGTAFHETAGTMQPITERGPRSYFNKYEPGTRIGKILGNTVPGDGYRFRGEGHVQNTGRRNARRASQRLNALFGLKLDMEANPGLRGDPKISALSLFIGNREGWWTSRALGDYLDGVDETDAEDLREFIKARAVVNGSDKAEKIGRHALAFEAALKAAGYAPKNAVAKPVEPAKPVPAPSPAPEPQTPPSAKPEAKRPDPAASRPMSALALILAMLGVALAYLANLPCEALGIFCGG